MNSDDGDDTIIKAPPVIIPKGGDRDVKIDTNYGSAWMSYKRKLRSKRFSDESIRAIEESSYQLLRKLSFVRERQNTDKLTDFDSKKLTLNSPFTKSNRTFDFDDENLNIIPVVYLQDRITQYNDDDTPKFSELNTLCQNLFQDEVLPEIRPDLYE